MRVKIFEDDNCYALEKAINDFLKDWEIKIIDIKYATVVHEYKIQYSAMIMYEKAGY